ncbi:RtcB family protein [Rufibacter latericius]|uniref:3'-phosphate/5'-hydroxy nucleic acid ligase n=1 Tax=Rufibacter latericius TaxID=2487040 RepID=A0A3M9N279_9BACT|nr:RtcB family protein [Rufibacter latericius]RNI31505.1 RtcB family protein [Rufibacter latericius]
MAIVQDNITVFGEEIIDQSAIDQLKRCVSEEDIGVLTADAHYGYAHPIGGAVAYKNKVSLSGVGFDIGCGNKAVRTDIMASDVNVSRIMDEIVKTIGFGVGRPNPKRIDHPVLEHIKKAEFKPQRELRKVATEQLGTVGSGNHFIDLFEDEKGYLWVGVHFGSRGFGHKTASGFIALSQGLSFFDKAKEGSMDAPPILFDIDSELGQDYIAAMSLAGEYAYAGRDVVVEKVLEILGGKATEVIHNHHNFAWFEKHQGENYWVVRKGCTPAFPGQKGFIGANMFDNSVIIEGVESELSIRGLYSTVHGAGRLLSRRAAAGKTKWIRDKKGVKRKTVVSPGLVDFEAVQQRMKSKGIELRGAGADEAPEAYKKLEDVLKYQGNTIKVLHTLKPLGVAMAGEDVYDPYKD